jgi:hypothetical protein
MLQPEEEDVVVVEGHADKRVRFNSAAVGENWRGMSKKIRMTCKKWNADC